ncbi:hypothetical protein DNTS_006080 [Danionella cerebrum]|uniref:Protein 4.1 n=1 Tax=Danionella cerebrum TaxID=2873325 RepID=A0A553NI13_9TELE|nr:hypothetical protein DNTS_006080 [Danionella translucida]
MTTDEAESVHKKQVCEQQQEEEEPTTQEPCPAEPTQDSPSITSPPPGGSEDEQQLKPRQRTSAGRGLSRLFSSFLKRRSQCSEGEGVETERVWDKEIKDEPKAPIADPEPELRIEGDVALDQHSISSAENQQITVGLKEDAELESGKVEKEVKEEKKEKELKKEEKKEKKEDKKEVKRVKEKEEKKEKKQKKEKEKKEKKEKADKEKLEKKEKQEMKVKKKKEKKETKNVDNVKGEDAEKDVEEEKEKEKVEEEAEHEDAGAAETEVKEEVEKEEENEEKNTEEEDGKKQKASRRPRIMQCKVKLLDDMLFECELEKHAKGQELFAKVCDHLNLLEKDYYGLAIWETPTVKTWLDFTKEIRRQVQGTNYDFTFNVKFYPPDPAQLSEDITRYYLCLQLRKDIKSGRLPCSFVTLALLGSYALQSELGEYDPELHSSNYAKELQLISGQTTELEEKVMELHRTYRSMSPAQADMMFLENAKKLAMYGLDLHQAKDLDGVDIMLGVCSSGLMVYKDKLRINRFPWPKVLKVSYKRSSFFIKIRPSDLEQYESAIGFKLPNYKAAKKLWKVCVEHHTFFRLTSTEVATTPRKFLALGSKFRYSGRTQAQTRQASSMIDRPAPLFQRSASKRASRSLDGGDPPPVATAGRSDKKETSTPTGRPRSSERKSEIKAEAHVTHGSKTDGTTEIRDVDKTQTEIMRHHTSISELKRSFMESVPEPRPSEWDKRLSTHSPFRTASFNGQMQPDPNALSEKESGMLLSAQTITSETVSTTTTTQITKTVKGGISETRIEKRIVITGDTEIDHDKALAQAIKEAKEQHPDMSVTKVVVHQETEITPEGKNRTSLAFECETTQEILTSSHCPSTHHS